MSTWLIWTFTSFTTFSCEISRNNYTITNSKNFKKKKVSKFIKPSFSKSQISKVKSFFYHDFADGGGRDAIAVFGLLEFLDGDGLSTIGRGLDPGQEYETIGALSDLTQQIVLLKPLRLLVVGISIVTVVAVCISHSWTNEESELCFGLLRRLPFLLSLSVQTYLLHFT